MKAVVFHEYGAAKNLKVEEVPMPHPGKNEVLVKVHAASLNPVDWKMLKGNLKPLSGSANPHLFGSDIAGVIEEVGPGVENFGKGDRVFGILSSLDGGAVAEYAVVAVKHLSFMPSNLSFKEAAGAPLAGMTALQAVRDKAKVKGGDRVLINGASGGVGHYAMQIAKAYGATVVGVCSTGHVQMLRELGADEIIDYSKEDFTERKDEFDAIIDTVGTESFGTTIGSLKTGGVYIPVKAHFKDYVMTGLSAILPGKQEKTMLMRPSHRDMDELRALLESGEITTRIDTTYPMEQIVEAVQMSEAGHASGKIIIDIAEEQQV